MSCAALFVKPRWSSSFSVALARKQAFGRCQQRLFYSIRQLSISSTRAISRPLALASDAGNAKHYDAPSEVENVVRPMATWLTTRGAGMDLDKVLNQLPRLVVDENPELTRHLTTALFLVTPQLAHLFEPGQNFHAAAMGRIFPSQIGGVKRRSIVAVVDALPAMTFFTRPQPEISGYEGLAVCISTHFPTIQVEKMEANSSPIITLGARTAGVNLGEGSLMVRWKAPVANTLFVNGRPHTMFEQHWLESDDKSYAEHMDRRHLSSLEIPVFSKRHGRHTRRMPAHMYTKLTRLTKPAAIVTSMGNIIRQIKTENGSLMAASQELERIIPPLVKTTHETYPSVELRVFALVYPPELANKDGESFAETVFDEPEGALDLGSLQAILVRGARLYRVTSGGAGWGNKAGLLSLEPTTELNSQSDVTDALEPFFDFQADSIRMPGSADLFPPGYMVQFVASWHDPNGVHKDALTIANLPRHTKWLRNSYFEGSKLQSLCVGTTIIPEPTEDQSRYTEAEQKVDQVFCPNRFGFLTASSMSLSAELISESADLQKKGSAHSTLIAVPNSSFIATFPASGDEKALSDTVASNTSQDAPPQIRKIEQNLRTSPSTAQASLEPRKQTPHAKRKTARRTDGKKPDTKRRLALELQKELSDNTSFWERTRAEPDNHRDVNGRRVRIRTVRSTLKIRTSKRDKELDWTFHDASGKSSHEEMEPSKDESVRVTEHGKFENSRPNKITLCKMHSSTGQPPTQKMGGKALVGMAKMSPSIRDLRVAKIRKHLYGRFFKNISSSKLSIRKLSADDPRISSRMPGPTGIKDDMEGLIRVRAEVPKDPEPEKDFKSLFYRSETSKEDEAVGGLLEDLLKSPSNGKVSQTGRGQRSSGRSGE